jgi:FtsP/CotA-like multicopper oxidase with cupredoxin domain
MYLPTLLTTGLLAALSSVSAFELEKLYKIPENHFLWGREGKPSDLKVLPRATTSSESLASTTAKGDSNCRNGALTRACWANGYSLATDFDTKWPTTGNTVRYNLEITNTTCNLDGHGDKICMLINNQYPGPVIGANWGDMISVTVKNSLPNNGTSMHWHGMRQLGTNTMDGVNGITECPIAPGDSKTYTFQATQYGTTWYHSHFSVQYGNGVVGPLVINGPAAANYDIDLGPYPVTDWYYVTADQLAFAAENNLQTGSAPPPADTILINGTNMNSAGGGKYSQVKLTKGKKHLLRLINTSMDNMIWVSLDGHPFTVITSDLVPIHSYQTQWLLLAIGQRYDVVINANQTSDNYWFRAEVATQCASSNNYYGRSIFTYSDATVAIPTSNGTSRPTTCQDPLGVPWWNTTIPSADFAQQVQDLEVDLNVSNVTTNGQNVVAWGINMTAIDIDWRNPTLQYVKDGNSSFPHTYNLIELPTEGIWTYWIIQETAGTQVPIPHPMHLHGHDVSTSFPYIFRS